MTCKPGSQSVIIKAATLCITGNCSGWSGEESVSILLPKSLRSAFCCLGCSRWIQQRLSKVSVLRVMLGVLVLSYMLESCLWIWDTHLSPFAKVDRYPSTLKWLLIWILLMWHHKHGIFMFSYNICFTSSTHMSQASTERSSHWSIISLIMFPRYCKLLVWFL